MAPPRLVSVTEGIVRVENGDRVVELKEETAGIRDQAGKALSDSKAGSDTPTEPLSLKEEKAPVPEKPFLQKRAIFQQKEHSATGRERAKGLDVVDTPPGTEVAMREIRIPHQWQKQGSSPLSTGQAALPKGSASVKSDLPLSFLRLHCWTAKDVGQPSRHFPVLQPCPHPNKLTGSMCSVIVLTAQETQRAPASISKRWKQSTRTIHGCRQWAPGLHLKNQRLPFFVNVRRTQAAPRKVRSKYSQVSRPSGA